MERINTSSSKYATAISLYIGTTATIGILSSVSYISLEYYRYCVFSAKCEKLKYKITPISENFNHKLWFSFFMKKIQDLHAIDFQDFVENMFWNLPIRFIEKHRIVDAFTYLATGYESVDAPDKFGEQMLYVYETEIEKVVVELLKKHSPSFLQRPRPINLLEKMNRTFCRINHPGIKGFEPSPVFHPFPLTIALEAYRFYGNQRLYSLGYVPTYSDRGFVFWVKKIKEMVDIYHNNKTLVYFHGFGMGVVPHIDFVETVLSYTEEYTRVVLVEIPGISRMTSFETMPTPQKIVSVICDFINKLTNYSTNVDTIGHSFGTVIQTYIANQRPWFFRKRIYIETGVFFPGINKFNEIIYSNYSWSNIIHTACSGDIVSAISKLGIFSEFYNQHVIHNFLKMCEFCNLEKQLYHNTLILLSENDRIMNSSSIFLYMKAYHPDVNVIVHGGTQHGDFLLYNNVSKQFAKMCAEHLFTDY